MSTIKFLSWDTDFFGYKIGETISDNVDEVCEEAKDLNYKLIYYKASPQNIELNKKLENISAFLADEKVTFIIENVASDSFLNDNIITYSKAIPTKEMYQLSLQSGIESRFKVDANFKNNEFEKLYNAWIENSVNKKIAQQVIVHLSNNLVTGLVTLGEKNNNADIGIIAVDHEERGKKIGSQLIEAAKQFATNNNYKNLQVVTQKANKNACHFYEKNGFAIQSIENIYHLWL